MFTGLVEAKGTLVRRTSKGTEARLVVSGPLDVAGAPLVLGESIAVDGVCLTVAAIAGPTAFEVDASSETLSKTTLGGISIGGHVNLERALPVGGRLGGHIVSGHVDGVGRIASREPAGGAIKVTFDVPHDLMKFIAQKGSICVSGVSLTVNNISANGFDVVLVPHTQEKTSLEALPVGAPVNLEVDLLARYVARLIESTQSTQTTADETLAARLKSAGYM